MVPAPLSTADHTHVVSKHASTRRRLVMAALGGLIAAFGLDLFLVPGGIIAGGVTGISALASHLTGLHTGMFVFALNLPLLLLAYRESVRRKIRIAAVGLLSFSICSILFFPVPALIDSKIGSAGIGGIFLGLGIGIGLRYGVILDTLQMPKIPQPLSYMLTRLRLPYIQVAINLFILTLAGLLLGWERAMYSAIACLTALETGRITTSSLPLRREVRIRTLNEADIRHNMKAIMGYESRAAEPGDDTTFTGDSIGSEILVYRVHILEMPRLKSIVRSLDPNAEIIIIQK
ncbi:YitT family protein [Paenibacillus solani]|uniref:YitT family protein n=1 Tax=Paenibacillus solani TaxID=1705565 RepID=UPI003D293801